MEAIEIELKFGVSNEINLSETPEIFREAVHKELASDNTSLIKVVKRTDYPYTDKDKESITFKAYLATFNLMTLVSLSDSKYSYSTVSVNRMIIADCMAFFEYWKDKGYYL